MAQKGHSSFSSSSSSSLDSSLGLVMTGGGARGAYQAGVLKRLGELPFLEGKPSPFPIISGSSAGAINAAGLACGAMDIRPTIRALVRLWSELKANHVYRTGIGFLSSRTAQWIKDLSFGGVLGGGNVHSLLDPTPLRRFLSAHLDFDYIDTAILAGHLKSVAITATDYTSGTSFIFIQGEHGHPIWQKTRRLALPTRLTIDHVYASAAIPIVFPPILVHTQVGNFYFGDGNIRSFAPLSPAIRLGATRLLAIGVRSHRASGPGLIAEAISPHEAHKRQRKPPPLAQVAGVALNAIFLDHLDSDLEHLERINDLLSRTNPKDAQEMREPLHPLRAIVISPSQDLGKLAESYMNRIPTFVHYLLEGLGTARAESADLVSYILFDKAYTQALIDIGYRDASARIDEIADFLFTESSESPESNRKKPEARQIEEPTNLELS